MRSSFSRLSRFSTLFRCLVALLLLAENGSVRADGTLISAPSRRDMVHDFNTDTLFITNGSTIARYVVGTNTVLPAITIDGGAAKLIGIDLSPDGKTLAVADVRYGNNQVWIWLVDVPTQTVTKVPFPQEFYEGGTVNVAFATDGSLFISGTFQGSGSVPLRRYFPSTNTTTIPITSISMNTMLVPSGDASVIGFAESNTSSGPVGRIRVSDMNIIRYWDYDHGTSWFNYEIGANKDGSQFAVPTYGGTFIYDGNMLKTGTVLGTYASFQPMGVVYHPVENLVYFPWAKTYDIRCYNTSTWAQTATYYFENYFDHPGNAAYTEGRLKMSRDGSILFCTVANGVRYLRLYEGLAAQDLVASVDENSSVGITLGGSIGNGGTLSWAIANPPTHGTVTGVPPNVTYTPTPGYSGGDSFTYKVRYGRATRIGAVSVTVVPQPAELSAVSVTPTTIPGGAAGVGTVKLTQTTSSPVVVDLSTTNAAASVPAAVTVPAGSPSATFAVTTSSVASKTTGLLQASYGGITKSSSVTVRPVSVKSVRFTPSAVVGGHGSTATVTLEAPAGPGDVTVTVTSLSSLVRPVDGSGGPLSSIVIPAGSLTGTFNVVTDPVADKTTVKVKATANGISRTGTLTLKPVPLASLVLNPKSITGGTGTTATITLLDPATPGDIAVTLASADSSLAWFVDGMGTPIASVVIPAGVKSVSVGVASAPVAVKTTVTLRASAGGTTKSAALTLNP